MRTAVFMIALVLGSVIPSFSGAPVIGEAVTEEEVNQFLAEYRTRLMGMEIDAFMELFAKDAVENRMLPYNDIRELYLRRMAESRALVCNLKIDSVQVYETGAFAGGRYEIIQSLKRGRRLRTFRGHIHMDLVRENGSLRIREVTQTPHP